MELRYLSSFNVLRCFVSLVQRLILWFEDVCSEIQQMSFGHKSPINLHQASIFKVQREQVTLCGQIQNHYAHVIVWSDSKHQTSDDTLLSLVTCKMLCSHRQSSSEQHVVWGGGRSSQWLERASETPYKEPAGGKIEIWNTTTLACLNVTGDSRCWYDSADKLPDW